MKVNLRSKGLSKKPMQWDLTKQERIFLGSTSGGVHRYSKIHTLVLRLTYTAGNLIKLKYAMYTSRGRYWKLKGTTEKEAYALKWADKRLLKWIKAGHYLAHRDFSVKEEVGIRWKVTWYEIANAEKTQFTPQELGIEQTKDDGSRSNSEDNIVVLDQSKTQMDPTVDS